MIKKLVFATLSFLLSGALLAQESRLIPGLHLGWPFNKSVLSSIYGASALEEITASEQWQKELNINSRDLEELRKLKSGKSIDQALEKKGPFKNEVDSRIARDLIVRDMMSEILDPKQMSLRRVMVLRQLYPLPMYVLMPQARLLIELGLTQSQLEDITVSADSPAKKIKSSQQEFALDSLESIAKRIPAEKTKRLLSLFIKESISSADSDVLWKQIQVLAGTDSQSQLHDIGFLSLDDPAKLSKEQRAEIFSLANKEFPTLFSGQDRSKAISADLDRILTQSQRTAIIRRKQLDMLISDFSVVLDPKVIQFVGLEKDEVDSLAPDVKEYAKKIKDSKWKKQRELLKSETSHLPQDLQDRLAELVEGVWPE